MVILAAALGSMQSHANGSLLLVLNVVVASVILLFLLSDILLSFALFQVLRKSSLLDWVDALEDDEIPATALRAIRWNMISFVMSVTTTSIFCAILAVQTILIRQSSRELWGSVLIAWLIDSLTNDYCVVTVAYGVLYTEHGIGPVALPSTGGGLSIGKPSGTEDVHKAARNPRRRSELTNPVCSATKEDCHIAARIFLMAIPFSKQIASENLRSGQFQV